MSARAVRQRAVGESADHTHQLGRGAQSRQDEIVIGALSLRSENAIAPRVLGTYERWPLRWSPAMPAFHEVLIAIERGEVDGCSRTRAACRPRGPT